MIFVLFCFSIHVVFGHVVSGHDLVRQLEQLPVDRNSRPLQDAAISNCGELVRHVKGRLYLFILFAHNDILLYYYYQRYQLCVLDEVIEKFEETEMSRTSF